MVAWAALILAASDGLPWGPYYIVRAILSAYLFLVIFLAAEEENMGLRRYW